ncbi:hypothetical protein QTN25_001099 [Entamoeba marina]
MFTSDEEYVKNTVGKFIKTLLQCIETTPSSSVVNLFERFAVNSMKEMNFVITKLNIFDRLVEIVKGVGGIYLPNNCAATLLRCFYTLYVNCSIGQPNIKTNKKLISLNNDTFLNDIEFLYSVSCYEVTTLFLEEFIRIVFIGHQERTITFF